VDALTRNGLARNDATRCREAQRAVDAYVGRGIPAVGLLATAGSFEDGLGAARVAAELARALADREGRPSLPGR
jgi:hypothetical protein